VEGQSVSIGEHAVNQITTALSRPSVLNGVSIIDADTHISEWHDLWTARAPAGFRDRVPQVKTLNGRLDWVIDDDKSLGPAYAVSAIRRDGSKTVGMEFLELMIEDAHLGSHDLKARLAYMDETGIAAQIAYPNVLGFGGQKAMMVDPELRLMSTQIYNDAMAEMQAASGNRICPMALMPWWDIKEAVAETKRCHKMGLRGINTNSDPHMHNIPDMGAPYWYPLWELCTDLDLPVNFHIGASDESMSWLDIGAWPSHGVSTQMAYGSTMLFIGNSRVLSNIILSLFLERFPKLKIVSVESGVGWIPFLLEALEYQMQETGIKYKVPPFEVFQRQIYSCSWFEKRNFVATARMLGVDNVLFETDFPHPTCLYPDALNYIAAAAGEFTLEERRKVFGGNAARVYNIATPQMSS
jgi:predicted TIM-barrel fold metal-dependent hydrolase